MCNRKKQKAKNRWKVCCDVLTACCFYLLVLKSNIDNDDVAEDMDGGLSYCAARCDPVFPTTTSDSYFCLLICLFICICISICICICILHLCLYLSEPKPGAQLWPHFVCVCILYLYLYLYLVFCICICIFIYWNPNQPHSWDHILGLCPASVLRGSALIGNCMVLSQHAASQTLHSNKTSSN